MQSYQLVSHLAQPFNFGFVLALEHVCQSSERFFDVLALQRTYLEKLEAYLPSEGLSVMRVHLLATFQVSFVRDYDA